MTAVFQFLTLRPFFSRIALLFGKMPLRMLFPPAAMKY